jgi:hypothetical protein
LHRSSQESPVKKIGGRLGTDFTAGSTFDATTLESKVRDESLRPTQIQFWLEGLCSAVRTQTLNLIFSILDTLRHTGLDNTLDFFCVAWPFQGDITQCLKIRLEHESSWARFLADSHHCATFAYITMECFETAEIRCSRGPEACHNLLVLETTVARCGKDRRDPNLQHQEICFFSKQDTMFWVKVLKRERDRPASLVELLAIRSIPYSIQQRLYMSERRKQRNRLRECAGIWSRGEVVSVSRHMH